MFIAAWIGRPGRFGDSPGLAASIPDFGAVETMMRTSRA